MDRWGRSSEAQLFERFAWHEAKRERTLLDRGIDFAQVVRILDRPHLLRRSDRGGEERFVAIGPAGNGELMALVYTARGDTCWVISARRAWESERRAYLHASAARQTQGSD